MVGQICRALSRKYLDAVKSEVHKKELFEFMLFKIDRQLKYSMSITENNYENMTCKKILKAIGEFFLSIVTIYILLAIAVKTLQPIHDAIKPYWYSPSTP